MDLCVWVRSKTTVHHVDLRRQVKSKESCLWKKHFEANGRLCFRQSWSCSDCSTGATLHGQFWVVHHTFFGEIRKRTRKDESLFTMAMRVLAHRLKSAPAWPTKTSNWWVNRRTALIWHPMTSFYFRTSRKYCVIIFAKHQFLLN